MISFNRKKSIIESVVEPVKANTVLGPFELSSWDNLLYTTSWLGWFSKQLLLRIIDVLSILFSSDIQDHDVPRVEFILMVATLGITHPTQTQLTFRHSSLPNHIARKPLWRYYYRLTCLSPSNESPRRKLTSALLGAHMGKGSTSHPPETYIHQYLKLMDVAIGGVERLC